MVFIGPAQASGQADEAPDTTETDMDGSPTLGQVLHLFDAANGEMECNMHVAG